MSTKIYNGFRLTMRQPTMQRIAAMVNNDIRPWAQAEASKMLNMFLKSGGHYSEWLDRRRQVSFTKERDMAVDTEFRLVFFPHPKTAQVYGIAYVEHARWFDRWLKVKGVREFRYWNNADAPDNITQKCWDQRGRVWDEVLVDNKTPALCGFTIDVTDWLVTA